MSEQAFDHIRPSAEHTQHSLDPEVRASGVRLVDGNEHIKTVQASNIGVTVRGDATPVELGQGDVNHEQFENLPVTDSQRWKERVNNLLKAKGENANR